MYSSVTEDYGDILRLLAWIVDNVTDDSGWRLDPKWKEAEELIERKRKEGWKV